MSRDNARILFQSCRAMSLDVARQDFLLLLRTATDCGMDRPQCGPLAIGPFRFLCKYPLNVSPVCL
jgi:hypothetical protein